MQAMSGLSDAEYKARGLTGVVVDAGNPETPALGKVANGSSPPHTPTSASNRPPNTGWIMGWATLEPTPEYPLLDDRRVDSLVRFNFCPHGDPNSTAYFRRHAQVKALDTIPLVREHAPAMSPCSSDANEPLVRRYRPPAHLLAWWEDDLGLWLIVETDTTPSKPLLEAWTDIVGADWPQITPPQTECSPPNERWADAIDLLLRAVGCLQALHDRHLSLNWCHPSVFGVVNDLVVINKMWEATALPGLSLGPQLTPTLAASPLFTIDPIHHKSSYLSESYVSRHLRYLAPEAAISRRVSPGNDIYSWGVLAYELVTGTTIDGGPDSPDVTSSDMLADVHRHITNDILSPQAYLQSIVELGGTELSLPPRELSEIIMLALSRDAEDRYQSFETLAYDLQKLSQICRAEGDFSKFTVGEVDRMSRFNLPASVIERGPQLEALSSAFATVENGNVSSRVVNVWGQSGNGKTRLVEEWASKIEAEKLGTRCQVGYAKPDEHLRTPLVSFVHIFQSLLDRVLTDPREDPKDWLERIHKTLDSQWHLFVSLLSPESRRLLGEESITTLPPSLEWERYIAAFKTWSRWFLQLFATKLRPLILVIDDIQWLPQSEIDLWRQILDGPQPLNHVMVITMARVNDDEPPPTVRTFSASSSSICVKRLTEDGVVAYIDTCLNGRVATSGQAIASFLYGETGGNPLFLRTLMTTILRENVVDFDFDTLQWRFDLVTLQSHLSDASFDAYLENMMRRLPDPVQELLKVLSYLPSAGFPLSKLSLALGQSVSDIEGLMQPCLGLSILTVRGDHFKFMHDLQRKAAQRIVPPEESWDMHRKVFEFLTKPEFGNDYLFDAVEHALRARQGNNDIAPAEVVVSLLVDASARASAQTYFTAARRYIQSAQGVIESTDGIEAWMANHRELCFRFVRLSAELSNVFHEDSMTFSMLETIKRMCEKPTERITVATILVRQLMSANRATDAMDELFDTLDKFGYNPENPTAVELWQPESPADVAMLEKELKDEPLKDQVHAHGLIMSLISYAGSAIFITRPKERAAVFRVGLSAAKALGKVHPSTAYLVAIQSLMITDPPTQFALRQLSDRLTKLRPTSWLTNGTLVTLGGQSHCFMPYGKVSEVMDAAFDASVKMADYDIGSYVVALDLGARLFSKLQVPWDTVIRRWSLVKTYATSSIPVLVHMPYQYAENIARRKADKPWELSGVFFSPHDLIAYKDLRMHMGVYDVLGLRLKILYDAPDEVLLEAMAAAADTIDTAEGLMFGAEMVWLLALAAVRTGTSLERVGAAREFLEKYTCYSPDLRARLDVLNVAEKLANDPFSVLGEADNTIDRLEDDEQFLLCGLLNFYVADALIKRTGSTKLAAGFIRAAFRAYRHAEAAGLCEMLRDRYPLRCPSSSVHPRGPSDFLDASLTGPAPLRRTSVSTTTNFGTVSESTWPSQSGISGRSGSEEIDASSTSTISDNLDALALMRSSLALAQEKDSLVLLSTLLSILCQFTRCDYAAIGLCDEKDKSVLRLQAAGPSQRIVSYNLDVSDDAAQAVCPTSVMLHVARTGVAITKPSKASRLRNDPFYNGRQPRSLMCLPIINQGELSGVILLMSMTSSNASTQSDSAREVVSTLATFALIIHTHHTYTSGLKNEVTVRTRELTNALQAKTQFLSQCSHELRSPLAAIMGLAAVLEASPGLTHIQREHLQTITSSGQDLLALISNILDHSKLESNSVELESIPFNVREVVESALDIIAPVAQSKMVELTVLTTFKSDPPGVIGDPFRVKQVLLNLLSNAVKFTPPGEPGTRVARVTVARTYEEVDEDHIKVSLTVADTGVGMPASKLSKLFKSFSQVDESITRSYGGSGLGLVISRDLARLLGGDCTVESDFGKGSRFTFTFVARRDPDWKPLMLRKHLTTQACFILSRGEMVWGHVLEEDLKEFNVDPTLFTEPLEEALKPGYPHGFNCGKHYSSIILDTSMIDRDLLDRIRALQPNAHFIYVARTTEISREMERLSIPREAILARPLKLKSLYNIIIPPPVDNSKKRTNTRRKLNRDLAKQKPLDVLIVDDSPVNIGVCRRILELYGYSGVDSAADGMQAVEKAEKRRYDLILLDLQMPILDGFGTLKRIRDSPLAGEPIIVSLSANVDKATLARCAEAGFFDSLPKPVDIPRLGDLLATVYDTRKKSNIE